MKENTIYHLAFVGSGISSSFGLLRFLEQLEKSPVTNQPIDIVVFEQYDEYIKGIPYGKRSGNSVLLITNLEDFLPEPERSRFIRWLDKNTERMIRLLLNEGGTLSKEWLEKNSESISKKDWHKVFIPRSFFGHYLEDKLKSKIDKLSKVGRCSVQFLQTKVSDLIKSGDIWEIKNEMNNSFQAKRVILAVGSLPTRSLWKTEDVVSEKGLLFINDLYTKGLNTTLQRVVNEVQKSPSPLNVAIIGANASALEVLYKLNDMEVLEGKLAKFCFISSYGLLPDCVLDLKKLAKFKCKNLEGLKNRYPLKAKDIYDAANLDLDKANDLGIGARTSVGVTAKAIGVLLKKLNKEELEEFACHYGNEIGRRQRCGGEHYLSTVERLSTQGRFDHFAGRFQDMQYKEEDHEWSLLFEDSSSSKIAELPYPVSVVINCTGSLTMESPHIPELIKNIIGKGYGTPNDSKIGFRVNENLESSSGLYIVGPLLAGNVIENNAVWHVEHCGRILWTSGLLSEKLIALYDKPLLTMKMEKRK